MTWATVADMLARFDREENPELSQLTAPAGDPADRGAVQDALDEAAAIIRSYIAGRALSVDDDANLRRVQMNLARWTLYRDAVPDRVQQIYEADIATLKAIRAREQTAGESIGAASATVAVSTIATPLPMRGY